MDPARRGAKALLLPLSATALLLSSGCLVTNYSSRERLLNAAREYNNDVRWGRIDEAAQKLSADARTRFFDRHKILEDELEIADEEMVSLAIDKSDKKQTRATTKVQWTWIRKREGIVQRTLTKQSWEERGSSWVLVREERLRGTPLSLFDEPPRPRRQPVDTAGAAGAQPM